MINLTTKERGLREVFSTAMKRAADAALVKVDEDDPAAAAVARRMAELETHVGPKTFVWVTPEEREEQQKRGTRF